MPRAFITEKTMPIILSILDEWTGKLTWPAFAEVIAARLNEPHVGRHALLKYKIIVDEFNQRKAALKISNEKVQEVDFNQEWANSEILRLQAENDRLHRQVSAFQEQFVRWQLNLMKMPGVDMSSLDQQLAKPLAKVDRRS